MAILTGPAILQCIRGGSIEIDPFVPENVNPASVDLRLGAGVAWYPIWVSGNSWSHVRQTYVEPLRHIVDVKDEQPVARSIITPGEGFVLWPGILYLMHTEERVRAERHVVVIDGKSSLGRLGISVHQTAGYGDPGFDGQYTLEVTVVHPVCVYAGMPFCQARFHETVGDVRPYDGNYTGERSRGPVPSRAFKMFEEKP